MSEELKLSDVTEEEDQDFRDLLEKYLRQSEELEIRENSIIKQMEVLQSVIALLKDWNEGRQASVESSESVHLDPKAIEEETRLIREETEKIQEEIEAKIEENRLLREKARKKRMEEETLSAANEDYSNVGVLVEEVECRTEPEAIHQKLQDSEYELPEEFFEEKLKKLKEKEKALKKESERAMDANSKKNEEIFRQIDGLEKKFQSQREFLETLKKKKGPDPVNVF